MEMHTVPDLPPFSALFNPNPTTEFCQEQGKFDTLMVSFCLYIALNIW